MPWFAGISVPPPVLIIAGILLLLGLAAIIASLATSGDNEDGDQPPE